MNFYVFGYLTCSIQKIARMQAESVEVKTAAENAAAAAKMEKEMPKVLTSKRTGKPLYTPQPLRSSACIYKEARMNSVSYESLAKTNASMDTMASSSSAFTSSGNANVLPSGNTLATLLLSVLAMGGFVEGFVLFSKTSSSPSSTSVLTYSQGVDTGLKNVKSLHETGYRPSTIKLIKKALDEQSRRQNAGM